MNRHWHGILTWKLTSRRWLNVVLVVASVGISLFGAELGLRLYYWWRTTRELSRMEEQHAPESIDTKIGELGPGVRLSAQPNVIYELRPNLRGVYDGRRFGTNHFGFRHSREFQLEKPSGVRRVVGVGDSWMWGSGVDNGETYLDRFAELLEHDGLAVEVVNTAVWGYNARQQVATLRWKGLMFRPDLVVVGLCGNDRALPDFITQRPFVAVSRSFLWNELVGRLSNIGGTSAAKSRATGEMMPYSEFIDSYAELAAMAEKGRFDVVVFSECFVGDGGRDQSPTCQLGTAEEWSDFTRRLASWGFSVCPWRNEEVPQNFPNWGHATAEGNRHLAQVLMRCTRELLSRAPR
jgi:hypothetical protein